MMVIKDENYKEYMDQVVLPYNKEREEIRFPEREEGRKLHLRVYTADQPKAAVVISHGFTESVVKYQEVIYYFLSEGYHVFMADHCGHGSSYRLNDDWSLVHIDSYYRYVEDLLYIAHICKSEYPDLPMYLYAHSMGGGVGAAAIAVEPKLFDKAILSSPMIRPATGNIPWTVSRLMASISCLRGKEGDYVIGQGPYTGTQKFENDCVTSKARFDYYKEKRDTDETLQTNACSYAWFREAVRLNQDLIREGWKRVEIPVLLFQAELEDVVSKSEHHHYIRLLSKRGKKQAKMVIIPKVKHEIFNSPAEDQEMYWNKIFKFIA